MKRIVKTNLAFILAFFTHILLAQGDMHSTIKSKINKLPEKDFIKVLNDDLKFMQKNSDSLWLYTLSKRYLAENDSYYLSHIASIKYYVEPENPGYGKIKTHIGIDAVTNDSLTKFIILYDSAGREHERVLQLYNTSIGNWENNSNTITYYDQYGYDSLTQVQAWNDQLGEWKDYQKHLRYRNSQEAIIFDVVDQWTGTEWHRLEGHKFEYFLDIDGCTDSTYNYLWYTDISDWFLLHKWHLSYDENNVQTMGIDEVFDEQLGKWRNFQQTLDYEFNDWCSCEDFWKCTSNPSHFIIQNWLDTAWLNIERFNATYDSLGGSESIMELWINDDWFLWRKTIEDFRPDGKIDLLLHYEWTGEQWKEKQGYDSHYTFVNDTLIEEETVQWDTFKEDWGPYVKVQYCNYFGLPIINSVDETILNHKPDIKLIPNPAMGVLTIKLLRTGEVIKSVEFLDQSGRKVFSEHNTENSNVMRTEIKKLNTGVYIVRIKDEKGAMYHDKLVKK